MQYAIVNENDRTEATPKATATCPCCDSQVKAKCGSIMSWHWAHLSKLDCDNFSEPMTAWHLDWQHLFPEVAREVTMIDAEGTRHRADVYLRESNTVIELQHSTISAEEVQQREQYYGSIGTLIWVVDMRGKPWYKNEGDSKRQLITLRNRPSLQHCKYLFIDCGDDELMFIYGGFRDSRCDETYEYVSFSKQEFVNNPYSCLTQVNKKLKKLRAKATTYATNSIGSIIVKEHSPTQFARSRGGRVYSYSDAIITNELGLTEAVRVFGNQIKEVTEAVLNPNSRMVSTCVDERGYRILNIRRLTRSERKELALAA